MAKHPQPLPTLWEVPDDLWERIEPMLRRLEPPAVTGRPRVVNKGRFPWATQFSVSRRGQRPEGP